MDAALAEKRVAASVREKVFGGARPFVDPLAEAALGQHGLAGFPCADLQVVRDFGDVLDVISRRISVMIFSPVCSFASASSRSPSFRAPEIRRAKCAACKRRRAGSSRLLHRPHFFHLQHRGRRNERVRRPLAAARLSPTDLPAFAPRNSARSHFFASQSAKCAASLAGSCLPTNIR